VRWPACEVTDAFVQGKGVTFSGVSQVRAMCTRTSTLGHWVRVGGMKRLPIARLARWQPRITRRAALDDGECSHAHAAHLINCWSSIGAGTAS
jgi:hypothetical protein